MSALLRLLLIGLPLLAVAGIVLALVAWAAPGRYELGTASATVLAAGAQPPKGGIKLNRPPQIPQGGMMQSMRGGHVALGGKNSQAMGMMGEMMAPEDDQTMHDMMMKSQDHQVMHEAMDEMMGSEEHRAMHNACLSHVNSQQQ